MGGIRRGCVNLALIICLAFLFYYIKRCDKQRKESTVVYTEEQRDSIQNVRHINGLKMRAINFSKQYMKETLNHPKSAKFPRLDISSRHLGDSIFLVQSHVDAKNSFGMESTIYFDAKLQYIGGDQSNIINWVLLDLITGDSRK